MSEGPRVRALALHAEYRCQRSGACCTSGWEIPVEPASEARLRAALRSGTLRLPTGAKSVVAKLPSEEDCLPRGIGLPHGAGAVLGRDGHGRCLFLETSGASSCVVHAQLGEDALPSACRHFPRVVRLTPRGVDVTLSSYCPTVARRLFMDLPATPPAARSSAADPLLQIVEAPAAFPRAWSYQGLDARQAVPPLLRPGVLMSWQGHEAWEAHAVAVMAQAAAPEGALERLRADAERIRAWTPADGDFDRFLERELALPEAERGQSGSTEATASGTPQERDLRLWDTAVATVPAAQQSQWTPPRATERFARGASQMAAGWPAFRAPVCRWLAAKAFGSWIALQGEGLRTSVLGLLLALGVLRAEAIRLCADADAGRVLDEDLLREAMRRADLLLLHFVDPEALARRLSRCERRGPSL